MKTLCFNKPFDCLLVLNGDLPENDFFASLPNIPVIAADGAAIKLVDKLHKIDYIVGDLDSIADFPIEKHFPNARKIYDSSQETNDFEKALAYCNNRGFVNIMIVGFQGGELEHTLNNWSVFSRFSKLSNLCLYERNRYGFAINSSFVSHFQQGETISLIPQTSAQIITNGLKWELHDETLEISKREGARNVAINGKIQIELISGSLLLFCEARLWHSPTFE